MNKKYDDSCDLNFESCFNKRKRCDSDCCYPSYK